MSRKVEKELASETADFAAFHPRPRREDDGVRACRLNARFDEEALASHRGAWHKAVRIA